MRRERERERHERIKMRLRLANSSLARVSRELGVKATTVTSVSLGQRRSRRIEAKIAEKLSTSAAKLWPDRYEDEKEAEDEEPTLRLGSRQGTHLTTAIGLR